MIACGGLLTLVDVFVLCLLWLLHHIYVSFSPLKGSTLHSDITCHVAPICVTLYFVSICARIKWDRGRNISHIDISVVANNSCKENNRLTIAINVSRVTLILSI